MAVQKLSVSFDEGIAEDAKRSAEAAGMSLSAWLAETAEERIKIEAGRRAVKEWEAENGEFTAQEIAEADEILDRYGVGRAR